MLEEAKEEYMDTDTELSPQGMQQEQKRSYIGEEGNDII